MGNKLLRQSVRCTFLFLSFVFVNCAPKNSITNWKIINTGILIAGDVEDKAALRECINKTLIDLEDSVIINNACFFSSKIKGYASDDSIITFAQYDSMYSYDRLNYYMLSYGSVDKIRYRKIHFNNSQNEKDSFDLFQFKVDKMLLYSEPYVLVMSKER